MINPTDSFKVNVNHVFFIEDDTYHKNPHEINPVNSIEMHQLPLPTQEKIQTIISKYQQLFYKNSENQSFDYTIVILSDKWQPADLAELKKVDCVFKDKINEILHIEKPAKEGKAIMKISQKWFLDNWYNFPKMDMGIHIFNGVSTSTHFNAPDLELLQEINNNLNSAQNKDYQPFND